MNSNKKDSGATVKDGLPTPKELPIPKPVGNFIIGKADKVRTDGCYYHYQTVCRMLQEYSDQQNEELLAWKESAMRELNALDLQSLGRKLGVDLGQSVSENAHAKIDGLLERVKELQSQLAKYREALERLLEENMCSHAGDELIEQALKQEDTK